MAIISLAEQQAIKPISQNWGSFVKISLGITNFDQLASEVQIKEFRNLLGYELYYDLVNNLTDAKYLTLINGTSFQNYNENYIAFNGLKFILAFMNYSKYVSESAASDTFTGMVKKSHQESEALSTADIKRLQADAREIAMQDFAIMKIYLNMNTTTYPLWKCTNKNRTYRPRISGLKRTLL